MIKLAPSLLSANFANLSNDIKKISEGGSHYLHLDIMDGVFVPNISFGIPVVKGIRKLSDITFDTHLMIVNPEKYFEAFAEAGADIINFHAEATENINLAIDKIEALGKKPALTIKPNTPVDSILKYVDRLHMVLIMSVEPGFGGQPIIPETLKKAEKLANFISQNNLKTEIEMDGGIYIENLDSVLNSGVNVIVSGSGVFGATDITQRVKDFFHKFEEFEKIK